MTHEMLAVTWFGLWGLIWAIYFVLDGYTTGTGMLFPFLARNEQEQKQLQETIGPFWGGNEVWLITAGGATFAAFPLTYALMFSYLYTPLFLILYALFFRAIGLEFMHKHSGRKWKSFWKWSFFAGSTAIALLFGVAFSNLYYGLNFDHSANNITLFGLLHAYGLLGGITFVSLFLLSGALWVSIKTSGALEQRAKDWSNRIWFVAAPVLAMFYVATANKTTLLTNFSAQPVLWVIPVVSLLSIILVKWFVSKGAAGKAFFCNSLSIFTLIATGFVGMFPNMLPSRVSPEDSVTLFQSAGSELNLTIMLFVAICIVPVVIGYQLWVYRMFRAKISAENAKGYQ